MISRRTIGLLVAAAAVLTVVAIAPEQHSPADGCARENGRTIQGTTLLLKRCTGMPGANGRLMYGAELSNGSKGDRVVLRFREINDQRVIETVAVGDNGYAKTALVPADPGELQACAWTKGDTFNCATTFDDPDS